MCIVEGCEGKAVSYGLCGKHRQRRDKHGTLENTRPKDWGTREKHPLYGPWTWMHRSNKNNRCERWDDFWVFVSDVGQKPSNNHRLQKIDVSLPYSDTNFFWEEVVRVSRHGKSEKEIKAEYSRNFRKLNPERSRHHDLKKSYGIGMDEYYILCEKQGHRCAICGDVERDKDQHSNKPRRLAVDHDHGTGKIRGLLCGSCNKGIGYLKDNPDLLIAASNYLKENI